MTPLPFGAVRIRDRVLLHVHTDLGLRMAHAIKVSDRIALIEKESGNYCKSVSAHITCFKEKAVDYN